MEGKPIVIFGCGRQAMWVAERLRDRAQDMLVVTSDESDVSLAQSRGFSVVQIDYTDDEALRSIGIGRWVSTVFCVFPEESRNVFLTISARALDPGLKIVSITESRAAGQKLVAAGATKIIDPYESTGKKIHELIRHPQVVETLEHTVLGQANLDLAEIEVGAGSPLEGRHQGALGVGRHINLILPGVVDLELSNRLASRTLGLDHRLDVGDMSVVIGPREEIERFRGALRKDECDSGAGHA
jgi:voltage-gated potassium channel